MSTTIAINTDIFFRGCWLKINIPYKVQQSGKASIIDEGGALVKQFSVEEGNNAIDISNITSAYISVKVETPYEIILKKINLNGK